MHISIGDFPGGPKGVLSKSSFLSAFQGVSGGAKRSNPPPNKQANPNSEDLIVKYIFARRFLFPPDLIVKT